MIYVHRYTLRSRALLNARSERRKFEGVLIRIKDGFGCIHPWPELGDPPIEAHLKALVGGEMTKLARRAICCCSLDRLAREKGRNLFDGLEIPPSHYSAPAGEVVVPAGFESVKIKAGDVGGALDRICGLPAGPRIRVDFNGSLRLEEFFEFWDALGPQLGRLEFVEDPIDFGEQRWKALSEDQCAKIAVDRREDDIGPPVGFRVVKPALDSLETELDHAKRLNQRVVFTSYMDHPIGQLFAACEAAKAFKINRSRLADCGLVTQHLFDDSDPFVAALGPPRPVLKTPAGTGLGFDDLLETLTWTPLKTSSC